MKVMDLYELLGETFADLHTADATSEDFKRIIRKADAEAKLAKQMIGVVNAISVADKMTGDNSRTEHITGTKR